MTLLRRVGRVGVLVLAVAATAAVAIRAAAPTGPPPAPAIVAGSGYVALGDSLTFGYREPDALPPPDYGDASGFVGYPQDVASALRLHLTDLACPGETSASMIDPAAHSDGCEDTYDPTSGTFSPVGYRVVHPLHVSYRGSQLAAATASLRHHPRTRLVTVMIGANDAFLCAAQTADGCTSPAERAGVAAAIRRNVSTILSALRRAYRGRIVVITYPLTDPVGSDRALLRLADSAEEAGARPYRVVDVDGEAAFAAASRRAGGDACAAGLLTELSGGGCGVHPGPAGQAVLARAVEAAVGG